MPIFLEMFFSVIQQKSLLYHQEKWKPNRGKRLHLDIHKFSEYDSCKTNMIILHPRKVKSLYKSVTFLLWNDASTYQSQHLPNCLQTGTGIQADFPRSTEQLAMLSPAEPQNHKADNIMGQITLCCGALLCTEGCQKHPSTLQTTCQQHHHPPPPSLSCEEQIYLVSAKCPLEAKLSLDENHWSMVSHKPVWSQLLSQVICKWG